MYRFINFKLLVQYCTIFILTVSVQATHYEIELQDTIKGRWFVYEDKQTKSNYICDEFRDELKEKGLSIGNIKKWDTFKESIIEDDRAKGIVGEIAAEQFFNSCGYKILEKHFEDRLADLKSQQPDDKPIIYKGQTCTTKKGPDNGIDGIFLSTDNDSKHMIINEAKFRNKPSLSQNDFGITKNNSDTVRQSHSIWNRNRFNSIDCLGLEYDKIPIIRTATLLNEDGLLKLYEIRDTNSLGSIDGQYPEYWDGRTRHGKAYKTFLEKINII